MPCNVVSYNIVLQTANSGVYTLAWHGRHQTVGLSYFHQHAWHHSKSMVVKEGGGGS